MHLFERNEIDHVLMTEEFTFCEVDPPWLFGGWSVGGPVGGQRDLWGYAPLAVGHGVFGTGSCEMADCGKGLIAIFRDFFASISEIFIFAGGMGTRLSFLEFRHFPNIF